MLRFRGSLATLASALRFLFPVLAGAFLGLAALIGAAAATVTPALFLLAGLAAFCLTNYLGLLPVTRKIEAARRRRVRAGYFALSTVAVVGVVAGTNAYQDEPGRYMDAVRTFLSGKPLADPAYPRDGAPEGYEGPR